MVRGTEHEKTKQNKNKNDKLISTGRLANRNLVAKWIYEEWDNTEVKVHINPK